MRTIPADLQTHIAQQVTSLAECLRITRADGSVMRLTTHDASITIDGDVYRAEASYSRSALQSTDNLSVDNAELFFVLDEVFLKKEDFENGLYDNAPFEMFIVNWEDPTDGVIALKKGTLGDIKFDGITNVTVQLRGLTQALQKTIVEKYSPTCRVNLGGKKCGIVNVPTRIRRNRQRVKTFDWYLVPTTFTPVTVSNFGFETDGLVSNGNSGITGWTYGATSFWKVDNDFTAGAGSYYLEGGTGDAEEMVLYKDYTLADLGLSEGDVDDGIYTLDLAALIASTSEAFSNCGSVYIEQFNTIGQTLLLQKADDTYPVYQEWEGIGVASFMIPGTRVVRIGCRARKVEGSAATVAFDQIVFRFWENETASFGDRVFRTMRLPTRGGTELVPIDNPSFEADNAAVPNGTAGIDLWTYGAGSYWRTVASLSPFSPQTGGYLLAGGNNGSGNPNQEYRLSQIKPLPGPPLAQNVTDGWYYLEGTVRVGRYDSDSDPRFVIEFLNDADVVQGTLDTGYDTVTATGSWYTMALGDRVPTGTTKVRVNLYARGDSAANVVFDDVVIRCIVTAYEHDNDPEYALLAAAEPTYDYTTNNYTNDGAALVQARTLHFGFAAVSDVADNKTFEIDGLNITTALFYSGKIVWLSGNNAGRTSFIRVWDNTSKIAKLYEKLPYDIQTGDTFVYAPGCDKTLTRCADFFGNTHNMRAEPYLPGQQRVIEFLRGN